MTMRILTSAAALLIILATGVTAAEHTPGPSNGIAYPTGWQDWATLAVSHRVDNNTIRVILGNDIAVNAAREGNLSLIHISEPTRPFTLSRMPSSA